MNEGYIMLRRSEATWELLRDGSAFRLLAQIALRAKRTDGFSVHGLRIGQALIGDYAACDLTEGQYRAAKARLKRFGLADFKGTNRGTIATLLNDAIFDINAAPCRRTDDEPGARHGRTGNGQGATNKNEKKGKNERSRAPSAEANRLASLLFELIRQRKADFRRPNAERWARDMDRLIQRDQREPERVEAVLRWCQADPFWQTNILSPAALRRQFDRLELQMQQRPARESLDEMMDRIEREDRLQ